jgi:hypothetical protein
MLLNLEKAQGKNKSENRIEDKAKIYSPLQFERVQCHQNEEDTHKNGEAGDRPQERPNWGRPSLFGAWCHSSAEQY